VDVMLIVTDANAKSLDTARIITQMAIGAGVLNVFLVGNRIGSDDEMKIVTAFANDIESRLIGTIPFDAAVMKAGITADPVMALEGTPAMNAIERMTDSLLTGTDLQGKTKKVTQGRKIP
jgi:CO dehydrogenase nickel-insertion accessory protein CooC1